MIIHGKDHGGMDESDMVSITCKSFKLQCDLYPLHLISFHCLIQFHVNCAFRVRPFRVSPVSKGSVHCAYAAGGAIVRPLL